MIRVQISKLTETPKPLPDVEMLQFGVVSLPQLPLHPLAFIVFLDLSFQKLSGFTVAGTIIREFRWILWQTRGLVAFPGWLITCSVAVWTLHSRTKSE